MWCVWASISFPITTCALVPWERHVCLLAKQESSPAKTRLLWLCGDGWQLHYKVEVEKKRLKSRDRTAKCIRTPHSPSDRSWRRWIQTADDSISNRSLSSLHLSRAGPELSVICEESKKSDQAWKSTLHIDGKIEALDTLPSHLSLY